MKKGIIIIALLAMIAAPRNSWAWGKLGHNLVAEIANEQLDEATRKQVKEYLGNTSFDDASTTASVQRSLLLPAVAGKLTPRTCVQSASSHYDGTRWCACGRRRVQTALAFVPQQRRSIASLGGWCHHRASYRWWYSSGLPRFGPLWHGTSRPY
jgi:hypothetical protein